MTADGPALEELGDMDVSQVSMNCYLVTNRAGDPPTGYMVDLSAPACECPDAEYNREDGEVCKHLAKANLVAEETITAEVEATRRVGEEVSHLREAVQSLEQTATAQRATDQAEPDSGAAGGPDGDDSEDGDGLTDHPVDNVRAWADAELAGAGYVEISLGEHNGTEGVVLEPDNRDMPDATYEAFKDQVNAVDDSQVHVGFGDDPCQLCGESDGEFWYFFPPAAVREVSG